MGCVCRTERGGGLQRHFVDQVVVRFSGVSLQSCQMVRGVSESLFGSDEGL